MPDTERGTLYLSAIDDAFDAATDIALEPACFLGHENVFADWKALPFVNAFDSDDAVYKEHEKVSRLAAWRVAGLGRELNARHGTALSPDFWRLVGVHWLLLLAQRTWKHFVLIQKLVALHGDRPLRVPVWREEKTWPFEDVEHFMFNLLRNPDFNLWIDSHIVAAIAPDNWVLEDRPRPGEMMDSSRRAPRSSTVGRLYRKLCRTLGLSPLPGSRFRGLLLAIYANLLPKTISAHSIHQDDGGDPAEEFPAAFLDVFERLCQQTMPTAYGDGFPALLAEAEKIRRVPGRIRLGTSVFWNDADKIIIALGKEAGEKLLTVQHGGGYGITAARTGAPVLEYPIGAMATWGWTEHGDMAGDFIALPSPQLSKYAGRHRPVDASLIIVSDVVRLRMPRLIPQPSGAALLRTGDIPNGIIEALSGDVRKAVRFRPYDSAVTDVDAAGLVKRAYPDIPHVKGNLHEKLLRCRMAVLLSPNTTLNYAVAMGTPFIGIWEEGCYAVCRQAKPLFDELKRRKVIFHDVQAAAAHINDVWDDIDEWWDAPSLKQLRQEFARTYCRTSRVWWWHWARALGKM